MGMTEAQVMFRVEVPNALPLMLGGLRGATLQVVSTATIAAYASLGGLGRYLIDGINERQFHLALVGPLMVAAVALILDGLLALAERERQLAMARDEENMWSITDHQGGRRAGYNGALDVDVGFSPFFNALPIRRLGLHERAESIALPMVYVNVPEMSVAADIVSYTSTGDLGGIKLRSPVADTTVTVDADGFIVDYPGLAERI